MHQRNELQQIVSQYQARIGDDAFGSDTDLHNDIQFAGIPNAT